MAIRGIRRVVELALDAISARRMQRDAQEALDRATHPAGARRNLNQIEAAFDRLGNRIRGAAVQIGAAMLAAFSVQAIKDFAQASIREFLAAEQVWNRLAGTLRSVGVEFSKVRDEIEDRAGKFAHSTPFGDEDYAATLQRLVLLSRDYAGSLENVQLVADLAVRGEMSLEQAATLVGKAMAGKTTQLERMFPHLKGSADMIGQLRREMEGAAAEALGPFGQMLHRINEGWGNFKEEIGGVLVSMGQASGLVDDVAGGFEGATEWVNENKQAIVGWGSLVLRVIRAIWETVKTPVRGLWLLRGAFVDSLQQMFYALKAGAISVAIEVVNRLNRISAQIKEITFGLVDVGRIDTSGMLGAQQQALRDAERHGRDLTSRLRETGMDIIADLGQAYRDVGTGFMDAINGGAALTDGTTRGGGDLGTPGAPGGGGGDRGPATPNRPVDIAAISAGLGGVPPQISNAIAAIRYLESRNAEAAMQRHVDLWYAMNADIIDAAYTAAGDVTGAWEDAFAVLFEEGANLQAFMQALGEGMAKALLAGLGQYAGVKVAENIAEGFENLAKASAYAAKGALPKAALAKKAAVGHFLAAAKWSAVAGAAGAAGGAIGGGGGGYSGRDAGSNTARDAAQRGPEVHIYIDPLDPLKPAYQDSVYAADRLARERYGDNARVTVHPRRG
jgi:hypothetical protein